MTKRINPDEIDESFLIASVKKDRRAVPESVQTAQAEIKEPAPEPAAAKEAPAAAVEPLREETRSKREKQQEYEAQFIRETDLPPARFGKSVYIRREFHDRISQIVHVVGGNEVSLFGYIDNIIAHHFEMFQDEIVQSFKKKIIFK
ncbi:MAG: DUF3408 domain-containing protein [Bacteroidales bacterium]|jgi:hypothetical protein|nr:DUF3408 domain-containing protein [Bacteroidales bacterium]